MAHADIAMLVPLAIDGELDPAGMAELERHLAECPDCAIEHARLRGLRTALRDALPRPKAPQGLAARILAAIPEDEVAVIVPLRRRWRGHALAALGGALAASLATVALLHETPEARMTEAIVTGHIRALEADHMTDLASADAATVRPWITGKLHAALPVSDLSAEGYVLQGARLDYVDGQKTAGLVYRTGEHVLTLYVLSTPKAPPGDSDAVSRHGYAVCHWTRNGLTYWAVGNVDTEALESFEDLVTRG